ncbi:MAG: DEAD/DEAH box helicase [Candidatus Heimdallarchaeota archaeon]|nr:DEAD/DEAH box helicase [Candidatus Heimdallarchaeota archaeon]
MAIRENMDFWSSDEKFPLTTSIRRQWKHIHKHPPSQPQKEIDVCWHDILPCYSQALADVIESIVGGKHPYQHQKLAIDYLLGSTARKETNKDLIINGGTYSGKSLSFSVPGIVKLLGNETDFIVIFYPSKQLLLDQYEHIKEYLVKLYESSGVRLTCEVYSGDTGKITTGHDTFVGNKEMELKVLEQHPPNILLATFDKVWYQLITRKKAPLIEKIMTCQYIVFDEIHAFEGFAAAIIRGFIKVHKKKNPKCQVTLSSATIDKVNAFRDDFLPKAKIITCPPVRGECITLGTTIEHTVSFLAEQWFELEKKPGKFCLVFLDSKEDIELLSAKLTQKLAEEHPSFDEESIAMIHADLDYYDRKKILEEVRKEQNNVIRILLSSSVFELGVNLPNVLTVVNIGIPITQKDGIIQRLARNRSNPEERRVNVFIFDLNNRRDAFYWNHKEILSEIIETNACNPILYPKQNSMIFAGMIMLHLRYGFSDFGEIMESFRKDGEVMYCLARQQYTKLASLTVLKKEHGKVLLTSQGENILKKSELKNKSLIPFFIRAINTSYTIKLQGNNEMQIGKITIKDVLRRGLPKNIIIRNRQKYIVTEIDHYNKNIYVKKLVADKHEYLTQKSNLLLNPIISMKPFSKKVLGTKLIEVTFGNMVIHHRPLAISNYNTEDCKQKKAQPLADQYFFWEELTSEEIEEYAYEEESEGLLLTLRTDFTKEINLSSKKVLEYLGKILQIEVETVLSIPASELELVDNDNQVALYDKGGANGNTAYVFSLFKRVANKTLERLESCLCANGCESCYGEILGLFPKGLKEVLKKLVSDLADMVGLEDDIILQEFEQLEINTQESRIIALSDIHLTSEYCFEKEFFNALPTLAKIADILVINGDLIDKASKEGWRAFQQLRTKAIREGFLSKLVFIRSSTIHDGNLEHFSGFLHQDYAQFEIGSERVLFVHGNKIGINPTIVKSLGAERAAQQAKQDLIKFGRIWLPDVTAETHLVIGHLHTRFYNERSRVYGIGHWTCIGSPYDQQTVMILDSSYQDTLKLFKYKEI